MPGPLISRQDIANGAVSGQPRKFSKFGGKERAARVFFYFKTANVPESMPHGLGRIPSGMQILPPSRDLAVGAPGIVYSPINYNTAATTNTTSDQSNLGRNAIVLACTTGATWCEVKIW